MASLVAQLVKNPPAMQETWVPPLGWEGPWRRERLPTPVFLGFPCSSAGKGLPAMRETWIQSLVWEGPWRRERPPTPVFWPGEVHGLYSPWGCKELDTTEHLSEKILCMISGFFFNLFCDLAYMVYLGDVS